MKEDAHRGQMTVEFLLLFLIAISLISISLTALINIKDAAEEMFIKQRLGYIAELIANRIDEVCVYGSGSSVVVSLDEEVELEGGDGITTRLGGYEAQMETSCSVDAFGEYKGNILIYNNGFEVEIKEVNY